MENFFSHKNSEIDFSKFNSALLIGNTEGDYNKSNGSGKSAIFEAILWCLFNKSRAAMMDDIIRWGERTCSVTLEFSHNDAKYMVIRDRNRMNSTSTVEFFIKGADGEWQNISCSTSGGTNEKIELTIKLDHKTFINSVYFRQNDISEFAESEPSKKKEILKSIVDISRWDDYEKVSRKRVRDIGVECKVLRGTVAEYEVTVERLEETRAEVNSSKRTSKALGAKLKSASEEIESLNKKYLLIKKSLDTDTYDKVIEDISSLKNQKKDLEEKSLSVQTLLKRYKGDRSDINKKLAPLISSINGKALTEIPEGKLEGLRTQLIHYKAKKASAEEGLRVLSEMHLSSESCYICNQAISEELYSLLAKDHENKSLDYKQQFSDSNTEILSLEKEVEAVLKEQGENRDLKETASKVESLTYKLDLVADSCEREELALEKLSRSIEQIEFKLKNNRDILESIKNEDFQALRVKLKSLREDRESLKGLISEEDKKIGRLSERLSVLSQQEARIKKDKKKIATKLKRSALFEKLGKMFGKGGIQTILLDFVIEDLEKTANIILSSICNEPAVIVLETQRLGADGVSIIETLDLKVRKDGHLQNFKSLSGGEKFRISLALRIALSDISSRYGGSSLEFLLLDEVNSPLDRYGVETLFVSVIKSLEDKYKILVITHDETLKEKFDNVINITKVNGESELEFSTR
jgi:DNA repair exonuclease SbcCD ATPase subunit